MTDIYERTKTIRHQSDRHRTWPIKTEIWKKNLNKMDEFKDSDYYEVLQKADKIIENAEHNALPVEIVSKLIAKCLVARGQRQIYCQKKFVFRLMAIIFQISYRIGWCIKPLVLQIDTALFKI